MSTTTEHRLQDVFRQVFDDPDLELTDDLSATDVPGWDSLAHISLMFSIESEFGIFFTDAELAKMDNVGALRQALQAKTGTSTGLGD
jgi:acyl carrier protein